MIAGTPELFILQPESPLAVGLNNGLRPGRSEGAERDAAGRAAYHVNGLVFVADVSLFTEPLPEDASALVPEKWHRTDEARATVGWENSWGVLGLGLSYVGDLGCDHLQNSVQRALGSSDMIGAYDNVNRHLDALAYWSMGWKMLDAAALVSTAGTIHARLGLRNWFGPVMVGVHGEAHGGTWPTPTLASAMEHERGGWLDLALGGRHWSVSSSWNPLQKSLWWMIALAF